MIPSPRTMHGVSKLGVLRPGAIGDVIVTLPAIESLHLAYPGAEIVLLGRKWCPSLLGKGRTFINRFITVPYIPGINEDPHACDDDAETLLLETIRDEAFDMIINFQGRGLAANPFLMRSGAGAVVSYRGFGAAPVDVSMPYRFEQPEVMRALELAHRAGGLAVLPEPRISVLPEDLDRAEELIPFIKEVDFVMINPFSTDKRRNWPLHNFTPVIHDLGQKGLEVIITGTSAQRQEIEQLSQGHDHVFNAAGMLELNELAALMTKAIFLLSPDTGPLHLARAVGCATIGLYWAPNYMLWGPLMSSRHKSIISWNMHCPLCGIIPNTPHPFEPMQHCDHNISFIRNISPEAVTSEINSLLTASPQII